MITCDACGLEVCLESNGVRLAWVHEVGSLDHDAVVTEPGTIAVERVVRRATVMLHAMRIGGPSELLPMIVEPVVDAMKALLEHYAEHPSDFPGYDRALDAVTEANLSSTATSIPDTVPEDWT